MNELIRHIIQAHGGKLYEFGGVINGFFSNLHETKECAKELEDVVPSFVCGTQLIVEL
jgi:hypothetical protein